MADAIDSSIIVAAVAQDEDHHSECLKLLHIGNCMARTHALSETFSTLTGGRLPERFGAAEVAQALQETVIPRIRVFDLTVAQLLGAMQEAELRGVRGGAIYDYLYLVSARLRNALRLFTLNVRHFRAFWRPGDPEIVHPRDATKLQPPEQSGAS
ncbi:MAG TPA: PIN domain-containing protein [Chthoniobacteraceae bacterium]|jgi:predicted nucleic acid-binding protein|nr:PIN domain-containing protein [Chthoniobacteraceae bacterium]